MNRTAKSPTDSLFKGLKALLASLPSEEEKKALIRTLNDARSFLDEIQLLVETFPTIESSRTLNESLSRLDILAYKANNNNRLRKLMGLRTSEPSKPKQLNGSVNAKDTARQLCRQLQESPNSDPIRLMEESGATVSVLTSLAAILGLRTRKKERKSELMNRIATHITNSRGYKILRGEVSD